jgi:hypothetical protein
LIISRSPISKTPSPAFKGALLIDLTSILHYFVENIHIKSIFLLNQGEFAMPINELESRNIGSPYDVDYTPDQEGACHE